MKSVFHAYLDPRHHELAVEVLDLKAAFLVLLALIGEALVDNHVEKVLPDVPSLSDKQLRRLKADLRKDLVTLGRVAFAQWPTKPDISNIRWLAKCYHNWGSETNYGVWELGRVSEIEQRFGPLAFRSVMECPPYAQIVLQGYFGAGIRHPEYHLSRDLALLNNLLLDADALVNERLRREAASSESVQSLSRSVILACFNLLESFVSGLVAAAFIDKPDLPEEVWRKLREPERKRSSLRCRFEDVPELISGKRNGMSPFRESILDPLFGENKWRRDAFVHCEPGPMPTKFGTVKEALFHDATPQTARETVRLTIAAIKAGWQVVFENDGPRWLVIPDSTGRFPKTDVELCSAR